MVKQIPSAGPGKAVAAEQQEQIYHKGTIPSSVNREKEGERKRRGHGLPWKDGRMYAFLPSILPCCILEQGAIIKDVRKILEISDPLSTF